MRSTLAAAFLLAACATTPPASESAPAPAALKPLAEETHFAELRQLTFGGENAEAYWSFDGSQLSLQSRGPADQCDRIYTMAITPQPAAPVLQSSGKGATTCAHYFPGEKEILYASTHLGGDPCPPKPDMSLGYVWALYDSYDIFKKNLSTGALEQLTTQKGYDAEATVCGKDGSIVFTSTRDGDIELYRMDKDGKNVKRLTFTPGYDGGAFFNRDCSKLVWRASRPKEGKELDEFRALLAKGLVRPTKLELFVGNADGTDAWQVTYLNAASFAPFWHPTQDRILFSSNAGDPKGREFDIWAINADGTQLEQITFARGFDGFPMFSPDGKWLAFSSNRATAEGKSDTNVFLARWKEHPP
ncbi:MAG: Peptidase, partial [Myxococcaceae bacterium]|nr:Peptidase [Myxococcaceae bacterium]